MFVLRYVYIPKHQEEGPGRDCFDIKFLRSRGVISALCAGNKCQVSKTFKYGDMENVRTYWTLISVPEFEILLNQGFFSF